MCVYSECFCSLPHKTCVDWLYSRPASSIPKHAKTRCRSLAYKDVDQHSPNAKGPIDAPSSREQPSRLEIEPAHCSKRGLCCTLWIHGHSEEGLRPRKVASCRMFLADRAVDVKERDLRAARFSKAFKLGSRLIVAYRFVKYLRCQGIPRWYQLELGCKVQVCPIILVGV